MNRPARLALVLLPVLVLAGVALAADAQPKGQPLPPGHPPLGGQPGPGGVPPPPPGSGTGSSGLTWTDPKGWVKETPRSSMRRAQYRIPGPGGDAECIVFYFGPGQGGSPEANVTRWAEQFQQPDGRPSTAALKKRTIDVNGIKVLLAEVTGTYAGGMGSEAGLARANFMLLGAIAEGPDANWFFKATGPKATLEKHRAAFEGMVRSIRRGAA